MRIWIGLILCAAAMCAAEKPAAGKTSTKPAKQATRARKAASVKLPPGAVEAGADTWHYTDREGRKWIYRKTPWGLSRFEDRDKAATPETAKGEAATLRAFDDGDYVRFERPGPFGVYKWRQSKSKLNEEEQRAWERAQAPAPTDSGGQK